MHTASSNFGGEVLLLVYLLQRLNTWHAEENPDRVTLMYFPAHAGAS